MSGFRHDRPSLRLRGKTGESVRGNDLAPAAFRGPMKPRPSKKASRADASSLVAEFLQRGGKIARIENPSSADRPSVNPEPARRSSAPAQSGDVDPDDLPF